MLLAPALVVVTVTSLGILILEGRPVLFIHRRVGRGGKLFRMPKLRTLRADTHPYRPSVKSDHARLATATGKFLRRHKLDELPQLFSVLMGHMSLIGPRPDIPNIVLTYGPAQRKRLLARPGVTGLWQLLGDSTVAMHEDISYDLFYLKNASLRLDIRIMIMTIPFVLRPR
jgi:lipopolysaccharide/colanic/teichoic acid biosynthesis glycosyltransferase